MSIFAKRNSNRDNNPDDDSYTPSIQEVSNYLAERGIEHPTDDDLAAAHAALAADDQARRAEAAQAAEARERERRDSLCRVCWRSPGLYYDLNTAAFVRSGTRALHFEPVYVRVCGVCQPLIDAEAVAALARRTAAEGKGNCGENAAHLVASATANGWPKRDTTYDIPFASARPLPPPNAFTELIYGDAARAVGAAPEQSGIHKRSGTVAPPKPPATNTVGVRKVGRPAPDAPAEQRSAMERPAPLTDAEIAEFQR